MTGAEVAFTIGSAIMASVLAVAAYFIDKWIKSVDAKLQKNTSSLHSLKYEVRDAKINIDYDHIAKTVSEKIKTGGHLKVHDISIIKKDLEDVKQTLHLSVLPHLKKAQDHYGKVILIEEHMLAQENKLRGLYDAVLKLVSSK